MMMKKRTWLSLAWLLASAPAVACLQSPLSSPLVTSNFGLRFHPVYHYMRPHKGTDFRAADNTAVMAAGGGTVTYAGYMGGGGEALIIMGSDGIQTRYLHLTRPLVGMNTSVSAGQQIALSGHSGEASAAPHLHFETRTNNGTMLANPRSLLCQAVPEKPGAGPDKELVGLTDGGAIPSGGSAGGAAGGAGAVTPFDGYDGMGEEEILRSETEKRFLNPEWYVQMSAASPEAVRREMALIDALRNWMTMLSSDARSRVESMMAVSVAQTAKISDAMAASRAAAAQAAARNSAHGR